MSDPPSRLRIDIGTPDPAPAAAPRKRVRIGFRRAPPMILDAAQFHAAVRAFTPKGYVTEALIGINVVIFVAMIALGVHPLTPTTASLLQWGADYGPKTTGGQWWRLFTAMFLHIGVVHVAMNMFVLFQIGRFVERLLGNAGFLILYVVAGLVGSATSVLWSPYVVSAGASGAIFGLYGALLGFLARSRGSIPKDALAQLQRSAIFFVGYNIVYGLSDKHIDMAAHIGGLGAGLVGGLVLSHPIELEAVANRWKRNAVLAAFGAVAILGFVLAAPRTIDVDAELDRMFNVEKTVLATYNAAIGKRHDRTLSGDDFADLLETEILPPWRKEREALGAMQPRLPEAQRPIVARTLEYMAARQEAFEILTRALRQDDPALTKAAMEKQAAADALAKRVAE